MGNKNAPFSVLMSVYGKDRADWLGEALSCVFAQTVLPAEVVLVKDGPLPEDLERVIDQYAVRYGNFKILQNERNLGLGLSLQKGVLACSNEIVARMDADDLMPCDRFEKQLSVIGEGYDVVSCWSLLFKDEDVHDVVAVKRRPERHEDIVRLAHRRSPVCHAACMMRRTAILDAGNYQDCGMYEDYHLWGRMIMGGARFYNLQEALYFVRTTDAQIARRGGWQYLRRELSVFREFHHMGFFSRWDLYRNGAVRIATRIMPRCVRGIVQRLIWRH